MENVRVNINDVIVRLSDRCAFTDDDLTTTTKEIRELLDDIDKEATEQAPVYGYQTIS